MNTMILAALMLQTTLNEVTQLASYLLGTDDGYSGVEYVDLKLPSKTLWATHNLGAEHAEDAGDFYAWGELTTKDTFSKVNYNPVYRDELPDGAELTYPFGTADQLPMLADAARQKWGAGWQLPSYEQIDELVNNCTWIWTKVNSVAGFKVYSKDMKSHIFLPAAGSIGANGSNLNQGMAGLYWTKEMSHSSADKDKVYTLYLDKDLHQWAIRTPQSGYSIRPVTQSVESRFDLNGDGKVSIADLTQLIKRTLP